MNQKRYNFILSILDRLGFSQGDLINAELLLEASGISREDLLDFRNFQHLLLEKQSREQRNSRLEYLEKEENLRKCFKCKEPALEVVRGESSCMEKTFRGHASANAFLACTNELCNYVAFLIKP